jgi:hypothetical protein
VSEPLFATGLGNGSSFLREMPREPEPLEETEIEATSPLGIPDDIEVPAFMRRDRRLYQ